MSGTHLSVEARVGGQGSRDNSCWVKRLENFMLRLQLTYQRLILEKQVDTYKECVFKE